MILLRGLNCFLPFILVALYIIYKNILDFDIFRDLLLKINNLSFSIAILSLLK